MRDDCAASRFDANPAPDLAPDRNLDADLEDVPDRCWIFEVHRLRAADHLDVAPALVGLGDLESPDDAAAVEGEAPDREEGVRVGTADTESLRHVCERCRVR